MGAQGGDAVNKWKLIALVCLAFAALGLIATGVWMLSPAAALIVVGGLVLIELAVKGK